MVCDEVGSGKNGETRRGKALIQSGNEMEEH
jgi:hypothetical protein